MLSVAREILVVAYGEDKAAGLAEVLGGERDPRRWPGAARQAPGGDLDPGRGCRGPAPSLTGAARMTEPDLVIASRDGTPIAVFTSGDGPPLILVHGTTGDHTTFRVVGPMLGAARTGPRHGSTRPGRLGRHAPRMRSSASSRTSRRSPMPWPRDAGRAVDVVGHSYGGRSALGAALLTDAIGRVVSYEGAPTPPARATTRRASRLACASGSRPAIGTAPSRRS